MNPGTKRPETVTSTQKVIVCGDSGLASILIRELTERHLMRVTVVFPIARGARRNEIISYAETSDLVTIFEREGITGDSLEEAGLLEATAVALMNQDDVGNISLAMNVRRERLSGNAVPHQRTRDSHGPSQPVNRPTLIIRMFNQNLTDRIKELFGTDTVVMSDADLAAPIFATAALGSLPPGDINIWGRNLSLTREPSTTHRKYGEWPLASRTNGRLTFLPSTNKNSIRVLHLDRELKSKWWTDFRSKWKHYSVRTWEGLRRTFDMKLRLTAVILFVIMVGGIWVLNAFGADEANPRHWWDSLYIVTLTAAGGIDPDIEASQWTKLAHGVIAMSGALLIPVVTGAIVQALVQRRMAMDEGSLVHPVRGHVIVVGLGNIGTRVVEQLRQQQVPVVAIERNRDATGVRAARQAGAYVLIGEAGQPEILRAAHINTSRSIAALTSTDEANLEAALNAQELNPDLHVVLRIYSEDVADAARKTFNFRYSYSVPRVAAGAFASAMTEDTILETIPVRHGAVYISQVTVQSDSHLDGAYASRVNKVGNTRLIAIKPPEGNVVWDPMSHKSVTEGEPLRAGQTLLVLASRTGLDRLLNQSRSASTASSE